MSTSRSQASAPKKVVAAITGQAPGLNNHVNRNNSIQGVDILQQLVNAGASQIDRQGERRAQLARNVPSPDEGSWVVRPDGTMDTTWHLIPNLKWHDGAPLTAEDYVFSVTMGQDADLPLFSGQAYPLI